MSLRNEPMLGDDAVDQWYYSTGERRHGPIDEVKLLSLIEQRILPQDIYVWKQGLPHWQPLAQTGLVYFDPPEIGQLSVSNKYVWVAAFLPLVYSGIRRGVDLFNQHQVMEIMTGGSGDVFLFPNRLPERLLVVGFVIACLLDLRNLRRAGYFSIWLVVPAFISGPIYLFLRAAKVKQVASYGFVCMATVTLTFLLLVVA